MPQFTGKPLKTSYPTAGGKNILNEGNNFSRKIYTPELINFQKKKQSENS